MSLTYGSVCSGIESASAAWMPLGWRPAWFAEVSPFPSAVLAHHHGYTQVPYRGKDAADCPDGPRYKALGNSMAVPVMAWIGRRIAKVDGV